MPKGAEDTSEEGVERIFVAHQYLSIDDLRRKCEQAEYDQAIEHLQLWVSLLMVLLEHTA